MAMKKLQTLPNGQFKKKEQKTIYINNTVFIQSYQFTNISNVQLQLLTLYLKQDGFQATNANDLDPVLIWEDDPC